MRKIRVSWEYPDIYTRSDDPYMHEDFEVDDFKIDDNLIIAEDDTERFIFPLSSIMMIEVANNEQS